MVARVRIGTFNVHGFRDATGKKRVDDVIELLRALDCDVLALNEVVSPDHILARVARALGREPLWSEAGFGANALLVRAARSVQPVLLEAAGELRSAIVAEVDGPGGPLDVVATHLDHTSEARRLVQLRELHGVLLSRHVRLVLAGDLNAMRLSDLAPAELALMHRRRRREGWEAAREDVVRALDGYGYVDAVRLALAGSLAAYHAALGAPLPAAHAVTSRVATRIDYVWLSEAAARALRVTRARTVPTDVSDHLPVVVEVEAGA